MLKSNNAVRATPHTLPHASKQAVPKANASETARSFILLYLYYLVLNLFAQHFGKCLQGQ